MEGVRYWVEDPHNNRILVRHDEGHGCHPNCGVNHLEPLSRYMILTMVWHNIHIRSASIRSPASSTSKSHANMSDALGIS